MNILITGANGQLGNAMRIASRDAKHNDRYFFTDVAELDITDADAVRKMVLDNDIDVIVNCAAYTNVERAEEDIDFARLLNATAVANLAEAIKARDGHLVHVSTDYVFGGNQGNTPRAENEPTNPTGIYGVTKLEGERKIVGLGAKALIFRTAWLYSEFGKNFVKTMLNLTATKPELKVVFDQVGTPTYARDLADAIFTIIDDRMLDGNEGVYHYSNEGVCSWFDFTKMIAEIAGNDSCDIQPCHSSEFPSKVTRPSYSVLDKTLFKNTFGLKVPYWIDSLKTCIKNLKENEA
ncbi:MAG: dTDP-4-dehydrorhamnose reductase [Muribaculaceae bacterium]|nr:dTDP-4-dehydrorhamnose reductase [Muribaculaceae bacterium]